MLPGDLLSWKDELWVGNFGDGLINNYDPVTGAFIETLMRADGTPLQFDGLWDLLPLGDGVLFHRRDSGRRARPIWADYRGLRLGTLQIGGARFLVRCQRVLSRRGRALTIFSSVCGNRTLSLGAFGAAAAAALSLTRFAAEAAVSNTS